MLHTSYATIYLIIYDMEYHAYTIDRYNTAYSYYLPNGKQYEIPDAIIHIILAICHHVAYNIRIHILRHASHHIVDRVSKHTQVEWRGMMGSSRISPSAAFNTFLRF